MKLRKNMSAVKPYVAGKMKEGAIKLASNENQLGPSRKALACIRKALPSLSLYPDSNCELLRRKLGARFGVSEEQVIVGNGSDELLLLIAGAYTEEGTSSVTSELTFSEYSFATLLFCGEMRFAGMTRLTFDLDNILGIMDDTTRVCYLANPNNPTGTYFTQRALEKFLAGIPREILVVLDEAYAEFVEAPDFPNSIRMIGGLENLLVLRTFSKMYGLAGLRVGYGIGSRRVIADLNKAREPFNVNSLAQAAAANALDDAAHVAKTRAMNSAGKKYFYSRLDSLGLEYCKTEANFVYIKTGIDADKVFRAIMERGITIRPVGGDAIRVTIGTAKQNELFFKLLKQVLAEEGGP
jgi:histidinol-phosphate aminotransferase